MECILWFIAAVDLMGIGFVLWVKWWMNRDYGLPSINPDSIPAMPECKPQKGEMSVSDLDELHLWRVLEENSWDLRCRNVPIGGGGYEILWEVIEHYQAQPHNRIIAGGINPVQTIKKALKFGSAPLRCRPIKDTNRHE